MQPDQPIPPSGGENPYDFILAGPAKPKKGLMAGNNSLKQRLLLVVGGAIGLIIILFVVFGLIFSSNDSSKTLLTVAQQQTEIIRVSSTGATHVRDAQTSNFTQNVLLSTTTAQQQTIGFMSKNGRKVSTKNLGLLASSKTDQQLSSAEQNGQYDSTLLEVLVTLLNNYKATLAENYKNTSSKKQKEMVQSFYDQVTDLLANKPPSAATQ